MLKKHQKPCAGGGPLARGTTTCLRPEIDIQVGQRGTGYYFLCLLDNTVHGHLTYELYITR